MKRKFTTSEGQNILDLVLTVEGSIEGLPFFLDRNPHINPNGLVPAGTEVILDTENQERAEVVNYLSSRNIRVNTGDIEIPSPPSGLSAIPTPSEIGSITLNWYDNSQGLYAFEIWRRKKGALDFLLVYESEIGETTWRNDNLDHGTTYEYKVRVKGFAGAVEFSNIAEATTPKADLEIRNTNSSKLVATGTNFVWDHRAGISYLFALSGKDKINSISACDAGVNGVIDLSSNNWLNLVYICFKNALNPDIRLGNWVNQTGVTLDVENAFYEPSDFERMLAEIERVNDPNIVISGRTFNAGIVLVDLDDNPTMQGRIDALTVLGWTIKIVNYKLLSATIGERTYVDFSNRVTANSGAELWFVNSRRVVGDIQLENGDIVELYHSSVLNTSLINLNSCSISKFSPSEILQESSITVELNFNQVLSSQILQEITVISGSMKIQKFDFFEELNNDNFNNCIQLYQDTGILVLLPYAEFINDEDYAHNTTTYYRSLGYPYPKFIEDTTNTIWSTGGGAPFMSVGKVRILELNYDRVIAGTNEYRLLGVTNIPVKDFTILQRFCDSLKSYVNARITNKVSPNKILQLNSIETRLTFTPSSASYVLPDFKDNVFTQLISNGSNVDLLQNNLPNNIERVQMSLMWVSGPQMSLARTYNNLKYLTHSNYTIGRGTFSSKLEITADQPQLQYIDANLRVKQNVSLPSFEYFPRTSEIDSLGRLNLASCDGGDCILVNTGLKRAFINYWRGATGKEIDYNFIFPTTIEQVRINLCRGYEHGIEFLKQPNMQFAYFSGILGGAYSVVPTENFIQNIINDASQNNSAIVKQLYIWDSSDGWIGSRQNRNSYQPYNTDFSAVTAKKWAVYFTPNDDVDPANLGFSPWTVLHYVRRDPSGREFWKYTSRSLNTTIDGVLITKIWREKGTINFTDEEPVITL
ncbi:fibronectin type III domain-containing protein [Flammeovirga aprica]|uniref:Fibronectin type III domain-containing protein n=1 Tax=Flammeovirga aprica JL-4 TaxID=694437 RepID=A0A7X9X9Q2_9BACT|nr:fibronectin type III domain-containing protein [Flammeovirga aprica]NME68995.1 fibronectin type III domain-containing protein [Flammeovirga aprica JL-4]